MNDRLKSVIYFFATILLITSSPSKSEETIIYIEIEREDNLSVLLYSTGITPLYGRGNAVERYTNRFPLVYNQELEIGTYAPLMRDEVIFYENLQETHPQHYRLRRRLYTLNDYDQYIAQPSLKKDETPPPPVHEKKQRKKYQFSTTASLGAQSTSRSYKKKPSCHGC